MRCSSSWRPAGRRRPDHRLSGQGLRRSGPWQGGGADVPERPLVVARRMPRWSELAPLVGPAPAARPDRPAAGPRRLHRGPAPARPAARPARGVRLHRRRRRRGAQPAPLPGGLRPRRVPADASCRTSPRSTPRRRSSASRRRRRGLRPHRVHPDDAHRGRTGGRPGRGADGRPLCPVHHGHDVDRAARRRRSRRPPLVPALPVAGPGGQPRPRAAGAGRPATRRWCSPSTPPWPVPGCATYATA